MGTERFLTTSKIVIILVYVGPSVCGYVVWDGCGGAGSVCAQQTKQLPGEGAWPGGRVEGQFTKKVVLARKIDV